jgi:hypothetical protein
MEVSKNPPSDPFQIQQQAPMPAEQFALERSDSRDESENGKRRRTEDLLERPPKASPQPEASVNQNLVQYFRGLELVSEKIDNLSGQVTGIEHGLNDERRKRKYENFVAKIQREGRRTKHTFQKFGVGKARSTWDTNRELMSHGSPYKDAQHPQQKD